MSRSSRIKVLLTIDVVFFFVELIAGQSRGTFATQFSPFAPGYAVGSLALVADSFHMLNDVMSLIVALYAIKLTEQSATDSRYSYGWHRAEILAALVNGVFLLALCFSISLEALERFFSTPEISNPRLVVIVGTLGLASNLVGLFLFHEHSHSHSHSHAETSKAPNGTPNSAATSESSATVKPTLSRTDSDASDNYALSGHPVITRAAIVKVAHDMARVRSPSPARSNTRHLSHDEHAHTYAHSATEETPLLATPEAHSHGHDGHDHAGAEHASPGHGHSHGGSMNMRALVLHVLGDALGNVGVIATGLVIWQTSWSFKYYFDPVISLVITVIIFSSALPLVRSASFVLLQGVPSTISLEQVRASILDVEGVLSLHELHIWQLSESKNIASVHVLASRDLDFMPIAAKIRKALHDHGIHSCTIQPEYYRVGPPEHVLKATSDTSCLVLCPPEECNPQDTSCCPPPPTDV
ncbi:cation efflux protein [Mycena maculata]|uniref:Cation efflux protein n=1 Tax=Mycena maculata TaxID=230809 RepID=A0AAD7JFF3_9AGAR|nr:cation efflux protein [Mycena maculata]